MFSFLRLPRREYAVIVLVALALALDFLLKNFTAWLFAAAFLGAMPTFLAAANSLRTFKITIEAFNSVALAVSLAMREFRSAAFIVLMLAFAALLDWYTADRARGALDELLKLKPLKALRETNNKTEEISTNEIRLGDIILSNAGSRIAADGRIIYGSAYINEAAITGESAPKEKMIGDDVLGGTLNESGVVKFKVTRAGKDSAIERIAALLAEASKHKSRQEKLADKFAGVFLPIVFAIGALAYFLTRNPDMVAAIFLVACADDMAVAIPLAVTAALGQAAKRGVIIKGGEWLDALGKARAVILDKTGTLTYGEFKLEKVRIMPGMDEKEFWESAAIAEKFSEHPAGRAIFKEAAKKISEIPDPDKIEIFKGSGIAAKYIQRDILLGNKDLLEKSGVDFAGLSDSESFSDTAIYLSVNKKLAGVLLISDIPRREAKESLKALKELGISDLIMFTGDNENVAKKIGSALGIDYVYASMLPEDKLRSLERFSKTQKGIVIMVGDGVNDAPALARADVGVAMGGGGAAVAVEAADIVILKDDLTGLPEMVRLSRRTSSVIKGNMIIWGASNLAGFALVFTGVAGPALAAFYNFATDFFPLLNSARLFKTSQRVV